MFIYGVANIFVFPFLPKKSTWDKFVPLEFLWGINASHSGSVVCVLKNMHV